MSATAPNSPQVSVKEGQTIQFIPRDRTSDTYPAPFYDFYVGLRATIAKIYDDGTAAVVVDRSTLSEEARERHEKSERDMRDKWMRSLSEDDRSKLTDLQKQFSLRYTLLVSTADLLDAGAAPPKREEVKKAEIDAAVSPVHRLTEDEINAAEAAHLEEIRRRSEQG
jgi:hypothetical protein